MPTSSLLVAADNSCCSLAYRIYSNVCLFFHLAFSPVSLLFVSVSSLLIRILVIVFRAHTVNLG